jgi:hypothetical protein
VGGSPDAISRYLNHHNSCTIMILITKRDLRVTRSFHRSSRPLLVNLLLQAPGSFFNFRKNDIYNCCGNVGFFFFLGRQHNEQHLRKNNGTAVRSFIAHIGICCISRCLSWFSKCSFFCFYILFCQTFVKPFLKVLKSYTWTE